MNASANKCQQIVAGRTAAKGLRRGSTPRAEVICRAHGAQPRRSAQFFRIQGGEKSIRDGSRAKG